MWKFLHQYQEKVQQRAWVCMLDQHLMRFLLSLLLLLASPAWAGVVEVVSLNNNADCSSFGAEIVGRWSLEPTRIRHGNLSWPLVNGVAETSWNYFGHGVIVHATVTGDRLVLEARKWGCRWASP